MGMGNGNKQEKKRKVFKIKPLSFTTLQRSMEDRSQIFFLSLIPKQLASSHMYIIYHMKSAVRSCFVVVRPDACGLHAVITIIYKLYLLLRHLTDKHCHFSHLVPNIFQKLCPWLGVDLQKFRVNQAARTFLLFISQNSNILFLVCSKISQVSERKKEI